MKIKWLELINPQSNLLYFGGFIGIIIGLTYPLGSVNSSFGFLVGNFYILLGILFGLDRMDNSQSNEEKKE